MSENLKPCPFCGSKRVTKQIIRGMVTYVECDTCGAFGPSLKDAKDVDRQGDVLWNTRAADAELESLRAQLATAKAALEVLSDDSNYAAYFVDRERVFEWRGAEMSTGNWALTPSDFAADALREMEAR